MIQGKWYRTVSEEEREQYVLDICAFCEFYPCEQVEEYCRFIENHSKDFTTDNSRVDSAIEIVPLKKKDRNMIEITPVSVIPMDEFEEASSTIKSISNSVMMVEEHEDEQSISSIREKYNSDMDFLSYGREELKNGCIMGPRYVEQVECGIQTVTDGIGDHYKVDIDFDYQIKANSDNRWEPSQPVFISAQTGQGKNFFVEKTLIPYVEKLNYENKTKQRVLILSNRLALKCQIDNRFRENDDLHEKSRIYSYKGVADVMTYQSLLSEKGYLKRRQKYNQSRYIFVICDEAHFFTSDAMFNPYTEKILSVIVSLFKKAIRVYMSATPYECLEYIDKYEKQQMVFYHFKRDYGYLNANTYFEIEELYGEIVKSVERKEKWLIFIDDRKKCRTVKAELEKQGEEMNISMMRKIYAVDADSKEDEVYKSMVRNEKLDKDIYVLITTSVLDNGVNLIGIDNVVVSDMSKVKCLQMVGRARTKGSNDHKTLYVKRFNGDYVRNRIHDLKEQKEAYHEFELAYGDSSEPFRSRGYDEYKLFHRYYDGSEENWRKANHWFGRSPENPNQIYPNTIAKSLVEKYLSRCEFICQEIKEEQAEIESSDQGTRKLPGQKYLEYQFSWFGKKYCRDNDITLCGQSKAEKNFLDFLDFYVGEKGRIDQVKQTWFRKEFTELHDAAYPRRDKNKSRFYGKKIMNDIFSELNLGYKVISHLSCWEVVKFDWNLEKEEVE